MGGGQLKIENEKGKPGDEMREEWRAILKVIICKLFYLDRVD